PRPRYLLQLVRYVRDLPSTIPIFRAKTTTGTAPRFITVLLASRRQAQIVPIWSGARPWTPPCSWPPSTQANTPHPRYLHCQIGLFGRTRPTVPPLSLLLLFIIPACSRTKSCLAPTPPSVSWWPAMLNDLKTRSQPTTSKNLPSVTCLLYKTAYKTRTTIHFSSRSAQVTSYCSHLRVL